MAMIIPAARLISKMPHVLPGQLHVTELFFKVPRDYAKPAGETLTLFARSVRKHENPIVPPSPKEKEGMERLPYLVFLEGGPGFGNREPQDSPLTRYVLNRGYQMLFLDYRGTGLSTDISALTMLEAHSPQEQADLLKLFRADNIVRDSEAVRKCLTADFPNERKKWTIFGQSFGGFVSLTYLSKHPEGLREVFMTGGLAPIRRTPEEVYNATFKKTMERNEAYYRKFPEDVMNVRQVVEYLLKQEDSSQTVLLPSGGVLTAQRFLTIGLSFGAHGGLDSIHSVVLRLVSDLNQFGLLTRSSLALVEQHSSLDTNPIYAILHEAIYCYKRGIASKWAASRVASQINEFRWVGGIPTPKYLQPLYFTGEMIFPFQFLCHPGLAFVAKAADILAEFDQWDDLYDEEQLRRNTVPVYAVSYIDDMYVDIGFARETASLVNNIQVHETNGMYHNAVRARTEEVLSQLFRMREDSLD